MKYNRLIGFRNNRLSQTNKDGIPYSIQEKVLVDEFNNQMSPGAEEVLKMIVDHPRGYLTPEEIKVAMTMVQWFGTNVGRAFHERCMEIGDKKAAKLDELGKLARKTRKEVGVPFSVSNGTYYYYDNGENQVVVEI